MTDNLYSFYGLSASWYELTLILQHCYVVIIIIIIQKGVNDIRIDFTRYNVKKTRHSIIIMYLMIPYNNFTVVFPVFSEFYILIKMDKKNNLIKPVHEYCWWFHFLARVIYGFVTNNQTYFRKRLVYFMVSTEISGIFSWRFFCRFRKMTLQKCHVYEFSIRQHNTRQRRHVPFFYTYSDGCALDY